MIYLRSIVIVVETAFLCFCEIGRTFYLLRLMCVW